MQVIGRVNDNPQDKAIVNKRQFLFRMNVFFFIVFAMFSLLILRLAILQFVEGPSLSLKSSDKQTRSVNIPPIRGNIYDSSNQVIAYSSSTLSLYFTISNKTTEDEHVALAYALANVFRKYGDPDKIMTEEDIIRQMDLLYRRNTISTPRRIKSGLTQAEIAIIMENKSSYPGIEIMEESVRHYSEDTVAVQLVGYLKKYKGIRETMPFYKKISEIKEDNLKYSEDEEVGTDGLEYMYQEVLRGTNGVKKFPINSREEIIGPMEITNPIKGADLYLTINKNVQLRTEDAIMKHLAKISTSTLKAERAPFAKIGYAVAMEVDTGKIIAMASMPDYDPNIWLGGSISQKELDSIVFVMNNGTIRQVYPQYATQKEIDKHPSSLVPLGSTMKPLSVLVGLNEGLFKTSDRYNDTGAFWFGAKGHERAIRNASQHVYGNLSPATAITKSSNPFMAAMIGNRLYMRDGKKGIDIWDEYMKQFGLGVLTGSGLPREQDGVIEYFNEGKTGSAQSALIYASFGQQGRYTTLQLAQYTSMLANHGIRLKPQFVEKIVNSDGSILQTYKPEILNTIDIPEAYWKVIEEGMSSVGAQGFDGFKYSYMRKTGTSEQQVATRTAENAVFIAYAPADKPKLAVAVVVPDGGFGGWGAAPIARQIFDAYDDEIGLTGVPAKSQQTALE